MTDKKNNSVKRNIKLAHNKYMDCKVESAAKEADRVPLTIGIESKKL